MRAWQLPCLVPLVLAGACSPGSSSGPGLDQTQPTTGVVAEMLDECPGEADCTVEAPHNYVSDAATVEQHVKSVVTAGCQRFHGDCAYLCDSIWYECGPTVSKCVEDETKSYLADYDYPVLDPHLAQECLADVQAAACTDIPPSTVACDLALVEGCPEDLDNLGAPYTWAAAATLESLPRELTVYLCGQIDEWLLVSLKKGDVLTLHAAEDEPSFGFLTTELHLIDPAQDEPDYLATEFMRWGQEEPAAFDPVDKDGEYYLKLGATETMTLTLRVALAEPAPAP